MTRPQTYTDSPRIQREIASLQKEIRGKQFSDIVDNEGHQYVDLVMEGGGVLGIALVGYTYALEMAGIRFLGLGGTSAGSINALLIAALGQIHEMKSLKMIEQLGNIPLQSFVDGDSDARDFIDALSRGSKTAKLIWKGLQIKDNLEEDLGLNPGNKFHAWLSHLLQNEGIATWLTLKERLAPVEGHHLKYQNGQPAADKDSKARLAVITADVTTETKVELPLMADLYWPNPQLVNPADFVRASMSIPGFFFPFRVSNIPQGSKQQDLWKQYAHYDGILPSEVLFIDGGIMSNFPINLFHETEVPPSCPTFGVKLGVDRTSPRKISKPMQLISAIFDSARHAADSEFLNQNPDYEQLITYINTGDHSWLDFSMTDADKIDLFARGVEAARTFLGKFHWKQYRAFRTSLLKDHAGKDYS